MWKNGDKVVALNSWDGSQYNRGVGARSLCYPLDQDVIYDKGEVFTVDMHMDSPGKVSFKERRQGFTYNPANFTLLVGEAPIPVGTRVRIVDDGQLYSTYATWKGHDLVEHRMGEGAVEWKSHTFELGINVNNLKGVVIEWERHSRKEDVLCAVMLDGTQEYIVVGRRGLEEIGSEVVSPADAFFKALDIAIEKDKVMKTSQDKLRRQLQSRIDKRSNRIAAVEASVSQLEQLKKVSRSLTDTYWKNIAVDGRMRHLADQVCKLEVNSVDAQTLLTDWKQELKMLASEQSLDKRLMAVLISK